ncbi:rhoGEF domain-containing protein gxcI [Bactrocera dorsalis]|uniref:RhoGEF domain-containing protein gxcI n=1 Tax=Bactrocera dorsalis TaxID=27457 RepID=A0A8N4L725_BACDO|nr:rhoGEF domain-containing protein gxcI [Bactrocera dorsalis]XP_011209184.2 rhoGEF domain-containing protein gxcI [Bactrocera dorsalis]XP_011209186.2 rhoGEF domain-containing protein gxcI [Bactrocera dorsalis]XP_019847316.2 rhoGEF domain-containing protein gxcI [Bactrocera dorsalis]XP_029407789.2 rhoGEF domain-containing protein gxcI [Bactrocera dorsalis]XP_029407790.2 rhoGEF domain-containing protein gxcI [Bactrocera dorsalis]
MTIPSRPAPAPPVARGQNAAAGANASIEQLRIQLQQQQIHQQQNRGVQKLTISLPPPPKGATATPMVNRNNSISSNNNYNSFNMDSNQSAITRKFPQARYTPTTNWEDDPFGANAAAAANTNGNGKKVPPPRPPPPKVQVNGRRAPQPPSTHSTKLLSNIFKSKKSSSSISNNNNKANKIYGVCSGVYAINNTSVSTTNNSSTTTWGTTSNATNNFNNSQSWQANWNSSYSSTSLTSLGAVNPGGTGVPSTTEAQLISFDSPPSSPTFTQKSNSDCLSVDSFSSDSNFSSPNNGSVSQPESGFEDDFSARSRPATTSPLDPWEAFDSGFNTAVDSIYGSTAATNSIGTAPVRNLNTINSRIQSSNDNPLCNGKSLLPPTPTLSVPTIIKPKVSQKPRAPKPPVLQKSQFTHGNDTSLTPPSPPMPICAPPPPPNGVSLLDVISGKADALQLNGAINGDLGLGAGVEESRPHGVALYAFDGVEEGDLSFRENEKIYILEQVSAEWYRGRTRSGCEGIFPINYIDVKVPLVEENAKTKPLRLRCLYNFPAEYDGDLALTENEIVTILYKINEDWLYGEVDGRQGQFPANFIEYLPENIPMA